jgi:hypothetical protein
VTLTPQQRAEYADALADGVPEAVIEEFDASLGKYIDEWAEQVSAHVKKATS